MKLIVPSVLVVASLSVLGCSGDKPADPSKPAAATPAKAPAATAAATPPAAPKPAAPGGW